MNKGSNATVVLALVAGTGLDAVSSVSVKYYDTYAQYAYDQDFNLPNANYSINRVEMDGKISLTEVLIMMLLCQLSKRLVRF